MDFTHFSRCLYRFSESFICIRTLFRVTSSGTCLRKMMYLGRFGDFLRALLATRKIRLLSQNIDRQSPRIIDRRWVVNNRQRSHPRVNDKLKNYKFYKSSNNYILSPWPPVRLYY